MRYGTRTENGRYGQGAANSCREHNIAPRFSAYRLGGARGTYGTDAGAKRQSAMKPCRTQVYPPRGAP